MTVVFPEYLANQLVLPPYKDHFTGEDEECFQVANFARQSSIKGMLEDDPSLFPNPLPSLQLLLCSLEPVKLP